MPHRLGLRSVHHDLGWKKAAADAMAVAMEHKATSEAAGLILATSIIAGVVGGTIAGETSIGFLAGLAVGLVMSALFWFRDRSRASGDLPPGPDDPADDVH
jgi:hypothetical protein